MSGAQVTEAHGLRAEEIVNSWQVGQGVPYLLVLVAQALADAEAGGRTAAREEYAQMAAEIGAKQLAEAIRARGQS